jgi:hypothetical protein
VIRSAPTAGNQGAAPAAREDRLGRWALTRSIRRDFWLSAGVFVAGEGLVGFLAILFKGFPGDLALARTLLSALLCAWTALAGLALIVRGWLPRYARLTIATAGVGFPLLVAFVWVSGSGAWSKLHWSAVAVLIGMLAVSAQRLWIGPWKGAVAKRIVFVATTISIAVMVPLTVAAIWGSSSDGSKRALGAFSFLAFIGFVLTPILRRALRGREGTTSAA